MSRNWPMQPLFSVAEVIFGHPFKSAFFNDQRIGWPLIRIRDLKDPSGCLYTTEDGFPEEVRVEPGDLLVGMDAEFRPYRWSGPSALLNQRVCKIVPHTKDPLDREFLRAALVFPLRALESAKTGTTVAHLNKTDFGQVYVPWPDEKERRAIAHILGTLDDKIELNRRMNETLEAIAQAIFKSWFVDFDPVIDNALKAGKPIPDELEEKAPRRRELLARARTEGRPAGLPEHLARLFPDEFEKSELGWIPKGWKVGAVGDLGKVICGKTPPTCVPENYGSDVPFVTISDMHGKVFVVTTEKSLSAKGGATQPCKFVPPYSICVSCIATPGLVALTSELCQTNQQINSVIPSDPNTSLFCYFALRDLGDQIRSHGAGGSVVLNLNKAQFAALRVLLPPKPEASTFQKIALPIFQRILGNEREARTLAAIRDTLLSKLVSGEIRVQDAEKFLEGTL